MEQLAAGDEAAARVHAEEQQDEDGRHRGQDVLLVMEAVGEERRDGDGVHALGVLAQALGHEQPVQIRADCKADTGPHGLGGAEEVSKTGDAHKQIARHVGRLGGQRREPRPHLATADEVLVGRGIRALGVGEAHRQHHDEVDNHGQNDQQIIRFHVLCPPLMPFSSPSPRQTARPSSRHRRNTGNGRI